MIDVNEARMLMPSYRKDGILTEVEALIKEAAGEDKGFAEIPIGFFGPGVERDVIFNAKQPPLFKFVREHLESKGFRIGKSEKQVKLLICWNT